MAARLQVRDARADDVDDLRALVRDAAQDGDVRICYEREPDYFTAVSVPTPSPRVIVLEDTQAQKVVGAFCLGQRQAFVNGERRPVWYGNELRLHSGWRGGVALHRMFRTFKSVLGDDWMQTIIMAGNEASLGAVASGRAGLPTYHPCGELASFMVSVRQKLAISSDMAVRRAVTADIPAMQVLYETEASRKQLAPCFDFSRLGTKDPYYAGARLEDFFLAFDGDRLVGMAGWWDQTPFKQSRVIGYSQTMRRLRPFYNLFAGATGRITLPREGVISRYAYLHAVACLDNDPAILRTILAAVLDDPAARRAVDSVVFGCDVRDPLQNALKGLKVRKMRSHQFLASYAGDPRANIDQDQLFYVEPSRM